MLDLVRSFFGVVSEETPKYEVVRTLPDGVELRAYAPRVCARVEYTAGKALSWEDDVDDIPFVVLAKYLGVIGTPENEAFAGAPAEATAEKLAVASPVFVGTERIPMTAPLLLSTASTPPSSVSSSPVGTPVGSRSASRSPEMLPTDSASSPNTEIRHMSMVLPPSKYPSLETVPTPTNPRVQIIQESPRLVAALRFRGHLSDEVILAQGSALVKAVDKDGSLAPMSLASRPWYTGCFNPPWTPGFLRRNEVYIDVVDGPEGSGISPEQLEEAELAPQPHRRGVGLAVVGVAAAMVMVAAASRRGG